MMISTAVFPIANGILSFISCEVVTVMYLRNSSMKEFQQGKYDRKDTYSRFVLMNLISGLISFLTAVFVLAYIEVDGVTWFSYSFWALVPVVATTGYIALLAAPYVKRFILTVLKIIIAPKNWMFDAFIEPEDKEDKE